MPPRGIQNFSLLRGASNKQLTAFQEVCERIELAPGEVLIHEGDEADALYLLLEGEVEVLKRDGQGELQRIGVYAAGVSVGHWGWLRRERRTATVRALRPSKAMRAPLERLDERVASDPELSRMLMGNIAGSVVRAVEETNERILRERLEAAEHRAFAASFMVKVLLTTVFYMYALGIVMHLLHRVPSTVVGLPILAVFAYAVITLIKGSSSPRSAFGLTLARWPKNLVEAVLVSLPVLLLLVGVKYLLIRFFPGFEGERLFDLGAQESGLSPWVFGAMVGVYALFVPIQELIARSGLQVPMEMLFEGEGRERWANVMASLLFSATHLHLSPLLALVVFPFGLYWGWLFRRQRSLLGPCVSHVLIGSFAFGVVGFRGIF